MGNLSIETVLLSYHNWAAHELSPTIALVAYLTLVLKRCVVPSLPWECVPIKVLYPSIQLVYGRSLVLLLAMVYRIQHGLRLFFKVFLNKPNLNPRIDLLYTYRIGWPASHY